MKKTKKQQKWLNMYDAIKQIHPTWTVDEFIEYMKFKKIIKDTVDIYRIGEMDYHFRLADFASNDGPFCFTFVSEETVKKLNHLWQTDIDQFYMKHFDFFLRYKTGLHHVTEVI